MMDNFDISYTEIFFTAKALKISLIIKKVKIIDIRAFGIFLSSGWKA